MKGVLDTTNEGGVLRIEFVRETIQKF